MAVQGTIVTDVKVIMATITKVSMVAQVCLRIKAIMTTNVSMASKICIATEVSM